MLLVGVWQMQEWPLCAPPAIMLKAMLLLASVCSITRLWLPELHRYCHPTVLKGHNAQALHLFTAQLKSSHVSRANCQMPETTPSLCVLVCVYLRLVASNNIQIYLQPSAAMRHMYIQQSTETHPASCRQVSKHEHHYPQQQFLLTNAT